MHKDENFAALIIASRRPLDYGERKLSYWNKSLNKLGKVLPQKWRRVIMLTYLQFGALFFQGKQISPRDAITNSMTGLPYG